MFVGIARILVKAMSFILVTLVAICPCLSRAATTDYDGTWSVALECGSKLTPGGSELVRAGYKDTNTWIVKNGAFKQTRETRRASTDWFIELMGDRQIEVIGKSWGNGTDGITGRWDHVFKGFIDVKGQSFNILGAQWIAGRITKECNLNGALISPSPNSIAARNGSTVLATSAPPIESNPSVVSANTLVNTPTSVVQNNTPVSRPAPQQPLVQSPARSTQNWNFVQGICTAESGKEYLKSCDIEAARRTKFPSGKAKPFVSYFVYGSAAMKVFVVPTEQFKRERSNLNLGMVDEIFSSSSIMYQKGQDPNSVLVTVTFADCKFNDLFRLNGSVITQQSLSMSGECGEAQKLAFVSSKAEGPKSLHIIH